MPGLTDLLPLPGPGLSSAPGQAGLAQASAGCQGTHRAQQSGGQALVICLSIGNKILRIVDHLCIGGILNAVCSVVCFYIGLCH